MNKNSEKPLEEVNRVSGMYPKAFYVLKIKDRDEVIRSLAKRELWSAISINELVLKKMLNAGIDVPGVEIQEEIRPVFGYIDDSNKIVYD